MKKTRLDKAFAKFIRGGAERVTPKAFFDVLADVEKRRVEKTIELKARVVGGKLQFAPSPDVSVDGNEIVLGNQRLVVRLR